MFANVSRIVLDAEDEARLSSPHQRQAEQVKARRIDDTTVMPDLTFAVEYRYIEPAVVRSKARGPDHRADASLVHVQRQQRIVVDAGRIEAFGSAGAVGVRSLVDGLQQPLHLQVGKRAHVLQGTREQCNVVADPHQAPGDSGTLVLEAVQVEDRPVVRSHELR